MTSLDFWTVLPEAALALFTLVALLLGSFTGKDAQGRTILWLTVVALLVAAFAIGRATTVSHRIVRPCASLPVNDPSSSATSVNSASAASGMMVQKSSEVMAAPP